MEQTFVMIKPDGVARGLIGPIIGRFERRGLRLKAMKLEALPRERAEANYAEHRGKPFFDPLIEYITSGPVVMMVVTGPGVVQAARTMMGATDPLQAAPGTIRGDFALNISENIIHGSDSPTTAEREIGLFFPELG